MEATTGLEDWLRRSLAAAALPGVVAAYLFGSVAEHREHRESDVDLGVLLDRATYATSRARFEVKLRLSSALGAALGRQVDVVVLNDAPPLLGRRIVTEGRAFLVSDSEAAHAFVRDIQLRAADLMPFLRRTRALKLGTVRG